MPVVDTAALSVSEGVAENEAEEATEVPADLEGSVMPVVDTAALSVSEGVAETEVGVETVATEAASEVVMEPFATEASPGVVIEEPEPVETETVVSESSVDLEAAASPERETATLESVDARRRAAEATAAFENVESLETAPGRPVAPPDTEQFMTFKPNVRSMLLDLGRKLHEM